VVESGAGFAGVGAEIATMLTEEAFDYLDSPVVRVTGANAPMPYARNLELAKTPDTAAIIKGVKQALAI